MKAIKQLFLLVALFGLFAAGCSNMNRTQKGAVIGAAGGGAIGGVIGRAAGNTAMGAIIGAAVGGATGTIIGKKMDQQAEEMKEVLGEAEVKRVGEGIVVEFKEKILFGFNQSELNDAAKSNLDKLGNVLQKYPDTDIEVIGHTDDVGSDNYNQKLSEKRANSVSDYLLMKGINSSRVKIKGMGESDPKVGNDTDSNRAENRRVEFVITANKNMVDEAKKESGQ